MDKKHTLTLSALHPMQGLLSNITPNKKNKEKKTTTSMHLPVLIARMDLKTYTFLSSTPLL